MNKFFALLIGVSAASAFVAPARAADPAPVSKSAASASMSIADHNAYKDTMEAITRPQKGCETENGADEHACSEAAEAAHEQAEKDLKGMKH